MVEIEGENLRPVAWVLIEELRSGDWGIAGNGLTTADVQSPAGAVGCGHSGLSFAACAPRRRLLRYLRIEDWCLAGLRCCCQNPAVVPWRSRQPP